MAKTLWIVLAVVVVIAVIAGFLLMQKPAAVNTGTPEQNLTPPTIPTIPANNPPANNSGNQNPTPTPTPKTYTVDIAGFAFSPATLTIKVGDTVTWTNKDSASHTVTSDSGSELASNSLQNGQTYSHTFIQLALSIIIATYIQV